MPPGHEHLVFVCTIQPCARGCVLPQRLVQRQRRLLAAQERERALLGVHHHEVAVVDLVADLAQAMPLDEAVGADVALAAVECLGGEGQHGLPARRRLPPAVHDDRRLARLHGEQAEMTEDAASGGH